MTNRKTENVLVITLTALGFGLCTLAIYIITLTAPSGYLGDLLLEVGLTEEVQMTHIILNEKKED